MSPAGVENTVYIRVLIADDQLRSRRSLRALLTAIGWSAASDSGQPADVRFLPVEIVGEAKDGQEAIEQMLTVHPDVVVMDLQLDTAPVAEARLDGTATIRMIKRTWPAVRIVVLTMYATDRALVLAAGADAFLLKGCPTNELLDALHAQRATGLYQQ